MELKKFEFVLKNPTLWDKTLSDSSSLCIIESKSREIFLEGRIKELRLWPPKRGNVASLKNFNFQAQI